MEHAQQFAPICEVLQVEQAQQVGCVGQGVDRAGVSSERLERVVGDGVQGTSQSGEFREALLCTEAQRLFDVSGAVHSR